MLVLGADWATISSLATAGGTLVLAIATFASVRSANRSARIAEIALQEQRRPVFAPSRLEDPLQKLTFADGRWLSATGGHAAAEHADGNVYLAISLRNVGTGIGVCQGWVAMAGLTLSSAMPSHVPEDQFRRQTRDLYIPAGDIGMWQGAIRNPEDPLRDAIATAIDERQPITIELLYSDQVGSQRTITRFNLYPAADTWFTSMSRHWYLDWDGPRPDGDRAVALAAARRDLEAHDEAVAREAAQPERPAEGVAGPAPE